MQFVIPQYAYSIDEIWPTLSYLYEQQVHFEIKLSLCIIIVVMFFNHDRHHVSSEIKL